MAWTHDEFAETEHEGYTIGVLASGVIPTYRTGFDSRVVREIAFMEGTWWGVTREEAPGEDAAWMLPACVCGWRGVRVPYTGYDPQAPEAGRDQWDAHMAGLAAQLPSPEFAAKAEQAIVWIDEMRHFVDDAPSKTLPMLRMMRAMGERVDDQIAHTVAAARRSGESWTTIGQALGVTRQTAWQRYRHIDGSGPEQ